MAVRFPWISIATKLVSFFTLTILALSTPALAADRVSSPNNSAAVHTYATVIRSMNPAVPVSQSLAYAQHMLLYAHRWKIDPNVVAAIVTVESGWNTHARSSAGAIGFGQLMPGTAGQLGVNPLNPFQNLRGTTQYLAGLLKRFRHKPRSNALAFAAYNAGAQAVAYYGGIPPFAETQHYVAKATAALARVRKMTSRDS